MCERGPRETVAKRRFFGGEEDVTEYWNEFCKNSCKCAVMSDVVGQNSDTSKYLVETANFIRKQDLKKKVRRLKSIVEGN